MTVRTLSDGPTTRQKILVLSIWIFSAIFGFITCFPDKFDAENRPMNHRIRSTIKPLLNYDDYGEKEIWEGTFKWYFVGKKCGAAKLEELRGYRKIFEEKVLRN